MANTGHLRRRRGLVSLLRRASCVVAALLVSAPRLAATTTPGRRPGVVALAPAGRRALHASAAFLFRREPYLLEFGGKNVKDEQKRMRPLVRRIERKLRTRVVRYDIYEDPAAYKLWLLLDKDNAGSSICGGLPFYYNRKTGQIVCGPTTYENLENWATGQQHNLALPPPMTQEDIAVKGRVTGMQARKQRALEMSGKAPPKRVSEAPPTSRDFAVPVRPPPTA